MNSNTLKQILDKVYWILGEDETSTIYHKEKMIIPSIHSVRDDIISGEITNILTGAKIRWGDMGFLHRDMLIDWATEKYTVVSIDRDKKTVTLNDTLLNAENFPLLIDGIVNIVKIMNGVIQNRIDLKEGQICVPLIRLPENCVKPLDVFNTRNEKLIHYRTSEQILEYPSYVIYRDQYWDGRYLALYGYTGKVRFAYISNLPEMKKSDDTCGLPKNYGLNAVANIVAGEVLIDTSEVQKASAILNKGYKAVESLYAEQSSEKKNLRRKVKVAPMQITD